MRLGGTGRGLYASGDECGEIRRRFAHHTGPAGLANRNCSRVFAFSPELRITVHIPVSSGVVIATGQERENYDLDARGASTSEIGASGLQTNPSKKISGPLAQEF